MAKFKKAFDLEMNSAVNAISNALNKMFFCSHEDGFKIDSYPVWENSFAYQAGNDPVGIKTVEICNLCEATREMDFQGLNDQVGGLNV